MSREHRFISFRQHCPVVQLPHLRFLLRRKGRPSVGWTAMVADLIFFNYFGLTLFQLFTCNKACVLPFSVSSIFQKVCKLVWQMHHVHMRCIFQKVL